MRQVETFHIIVMILLFPTFYNAFFENSQADFTDGSAEQVKTTGLAGGRHVEKARLRRTFPTDLRRPPSVPTGSGRRKVF